MPVNLLIAAHPDDETIGLGGQLREFADLRIVHVTDGAPRDPREFTAKGFATREEYAAARRRELHRALAIASIAPERAVCLGVVDQEASRNLAGLARRMCGVLREYAPEAVYTHAYEGGHPDHDACAFAVHAACRMIASPPMIREFALYHRRGGKMITGEFADSKGVTTVVLSREARERKQRMIDCFESQRETLRPFRCDVERIRTAPRYDFTRPPAEEIHYDAFQWGMNSGEWLECARAALAAL